MIQHRITLELIIIVKRARVQYMAAIRDRWCHTIGPTLEKFAVSLWGWTKRNLEWVTDATKLTCVLSERH